MVSATWAAGVATLASEEGGGTQNFLVPNGTFFFVLAIFLIVLGVIWKFVVPPVTQVLGERERMLAQTASDNRRSSELEKAAEADHNKELAAARSEAAAIRDGARSEGREVVDAEKAQANEAVAGTLATANAELKTQSDAIAPNLRASVETLSQTLASRVLGVPAGASSSGAPSSPAYTPSGTTYPGSDTTYTVSEG
jgi:F-type H+-transporting ATPase subunit b